MGMGLSNFLGSNPSGRGGRGQYLNWKDKGSVVVWLHTKSDIHYAFIHSFLMEDEVEDKESGKSKAILRFPKFVSTEPLDVLQRQFFRDKSTDHMEAMPTQDPFLIMREWIRAQVRTERLAPDAVVFEWFDPKNRQIIQWQAGHVSGLVKRPKNAWNHSLDAKLQYVFCLVDANDIGAGVQIAQESQALGDGMRKEITRQIESRGVEAGDPTIEPYAFKWTFTKDARNPNDTYGCFRFDRAECTDDIWKLITEADVPDVSKLIHAQDGDHDRIRAAMERAARIDLPFDLVFSPDANDRRHAVLGADIGAPGRSATRSTGGTAPKVPSTTGGARRPGTTGAASQPGQGASAPATRPNPPTTPTAPAQTGTQTGPRSRRRVDAPPPPPPPPEEGLIPCDDCGTPMRADESTCPKCGAKYDVDGAGEAPPPPPPVTGARRPGPTASAAATQSASSSGGKPPARRPDAAPAAKPCWSCGSNDIIDNRCQSCGMDQDDGGGIGDDDIPF